MFKFEVISETGFSFAETVQVKPLSHGLPNVLFYLLLSTNLPGTEVRLTGVQFPRLSLSIGKTFATLQSSGTVSVLMRIL